jgi:hypothetical protein
MNCVSHALVLEDGNRLACNRLFPDPHRGGYVRIAFRDLRNIPARLAPAPAGLEVTEQQLKQRKIPYERGTLGIDAHRILVRLSRLTEASKLRQDECPVRGASDVRPQSQ